MYFNLQWVVGSPLKHEKSKTNSEMRLVIGGLLDFLAAGDANKALRPTCEKSWRRRRAAMIFWNSTDLVLYIQRNQTT